MVRDEVGVISMVVILSESVFKVSSRLFFYQPRCKKMGVEGIFSMVCRHVCSVFPCAPAPPPLLCPPPPHVSSVFPCAPAPPPPPLPPPTPLEIIGPITCGGWGSFYLVHKIFFVVAVVGQYPSIECSVTFAS